MLVPGKHCQAGLPLFEPCLTSIIWPTPVEETSIRAYHAVVPKRTIEEEEAEEREWDAIVSQPHVRQALRRMAAEVRRQIASGEIEEGSREIE